VVNELKEAFHDKAGVQIGKSGITEGVLANIKEVLKQTSPLKIKILKAAIDGEKTATYYANEVTKALHVKLVGVRGNTFVISK
jgi:RNA-binding protein YhbY